MILFIHENKTPKSPEPINNEKEWTILSKIMLFKSEASKTSYYDETTHIKAEVQLTKPEAHTTLYTKRKT